MWSYGDYAKVAELLWPGAVRLVDQLGDQSGAAHLDIATGNGNVAVLTAGLGASVTGLDLTAEFFPDARRRATEQGSTIRFLEGNVERLPFPDRSFDTVTSAYGIQFAPRHRRAAAEVARVCKPEGVLGMCNWTPRSWTAHFHEVISDYFPAPPEFAGQPMRWGDERYLQRLLGDAFVLTTERHELWYPFSTGKELIGFFESCFGPLIAARRSVSPRSRWSELRNELVEMSAEFVTTDHRGTGVPVEYLLVIGRRRRAR
ncbi:class I SAM-dependent methyltransferase [Actinomadura sp. 9N215]|uniref:class I SAM-dependent methyltransferase n=1 Tax=Actinomadura sp. 9N215 TaxID=3375150 RepID=UPI0037B52A6B